jgi:hypothetical protein
MKKNKEKSLADKMCSKVFTFYNSDMNRNKLKGNPKPISIYDFQILVYLAEKKNIDSTLKNSASKTLKKYLGWI